MKESMQPLHVMYSYKSNAVDITNSFLQKFDGLSVKADIYNLDGTNKYSNTITTSVDEDGIKECFALPNISDLSDTYFLRLELKDADGKIKDINWYWLSQKSDELNWKKSKWYYTPESSFTDYTALNNMPQTSVDVEHSSDKNADSTTHKITIKNTGKAVAFFVHVRVLKQKNADDILPVIFSDNYISLAPGESRIVECTYSNKDADDETPFVLINGRNLNAAQSKGEKNVGFE
jgi:exo-1,4-beta-D-glucosaminidase